MGSLGTISAALALTSLPRSTTLLNEASSGTSTAYPGFPVSGSTRCTNCSVAAKFGSADAGVRSAGRANDDASSGVMVRWPLVGKRSEEHTSELQSLMRISYAVFCLKKKKNQYHNIYTVDM